MQSRNTNAKINQIKHQQRKSLTLGKNHSRHLCTYMEGCMDEAIGRYSFMKMGTYSTRYFIFDILNFNLLAYSKIKFKMKK